MNEQADWLWDFLPGLAVGLLIFCVVLAVGFLIGRGIRLATARQGQRIHAQIVSKLPLWIAAFIGALLALNAMGFEGVAAGLLAGGGATAIVFGFAFRQIGENLLAGLFLVFSRPFRIGDLIQSGDLPEGTVEALDLRNTHIRTADGRDVFIPNARIYNEPLVNFTRDGLRRPTMVLGMDYRTPFPELRGAVLAAISAVPGALVSPAPSVNLVGFGTGAVEVEIYVWIDTHQGTDFATVQTLMMEAALAAVLQRGWTVSSEVTTAVVFPDGGPPAPA